MNKELRNNNEQDQVKKEQKNKKQINIRFYLLESIFIVLTVLTSITLSHNKIYSKIFFFERKNQKVVSGRKQRDFAKMERKIICIVQVRHTRLQNVSRETREPMRFPELSRRKLVSCDL